MYAAASNINATMGINGTGAGKAVGKMTSVGVNEAGQIVASYSNGDTKKIGPDCRLHHLLTHQVLKSW